MTLSKRLLLYFGGFGMGMILLLFFLGGKRASCDYLPNARTLKDIRQKQRIFPQDILAELQSHQLDTSAIDYLFTHGKVDFKASNTSLDSCKMYTIKGSYHERQLVLQVENCPLEATIKNLEIRR